MSKLPDPTLLDQAIMHQKAGRAAQAEAIYNRILSDEPKHPDALHNLGLLLLDQGNRDKAQHLLAEALESRPTEGQFWLDYAHGLDRAGLVEAAWQVLQEARKLGLQGEAADALEAAIRPRRSEGPPPNLDLLFSQGRYGEVEAIAHAVSIGQRGSATLLGIRGAALASLGRSEEALEAMRRSVELAPDHPQLAVNLGLFLSSLRRHAEAERHLRRALQNQPGNLEALLGLAIALNEQTRAEEALQLLKPLVEAHPGDPSLLNNLGNSYILLNRPAEAEDCYRRALLLRDDVAAFYSNLGNALLIQGKLAEADANYLEALKLNPGLADAYANLADARRLQAKLAEGYANARKAIQIDPALAMGHCLVGMLSAYLSEHTDVVPESDRALQLSPSGTIWDSRLYSFSYHPDLPAEAIYREFVRWGDRFPDPASDFSAQDRTPGRRLRVGYVSPDFRRHTSRFFFMPLMAHHDHGAFETFAYSNVLVEDEHTQAFKGVFDQWRNLRGVPAADAARMIREDGIDILVDCCNHMRDDRLDVFALKPAPIQVTWLGAAWTTGLKTVDYVLFDPHLAPEGTLAREEIVRLPDCFIAYRPPAVTAEVGPLPALARGYVTFGYSGRTERLNHKTFRVWGELLDRIPGARLILDYPPFADPPTQAHYRELMARHGLDPARVEMRRSENIFLGLNDIDILLDCFPHSGGTMLFDALWMGVPALTLKSRPPLGRIGATLMTNLGMTDWIAETEADYVAKAAAFSSDLEALSATRAGLRRRMQASPLMDEPGFAKAVEAAYQTMWARWTGP